MDGRVVVEEGKLDWCRPSPADSASSGRSGHEPSYSVVGDSAQALGVDLELSRWSGLGPVALCPKAERCCPESSACGRAKQAKGGSLRRAGIFVGLAVAEGCKGSGHRDAGDTAMTRVSVWGDWAKLCCTPRLWEALSAVSTEEAGWQGARHNGPPRRVADSACTLGPLYLCLCLCLCPCSVLVAGSGPTMHAMSSQRGGSGIAGRTYSLVWVCPTGERGTTDSVTQSLPAQGLPSEPHVKISSRTRKVSNATLPRPGPYRTVIKSGYERVLAKRP